MEFTFGKGCAQFVEGVEGACLAFGGYSLGLCDVFESGFHLSD